MRIPRGVLLALPLLAFLPGCPIYTGDGYTPIAPECSSSFDCLDGERCVGGYCTADECIDNTECDAGEICDRGSCVPDRPSTCRTHGDCDVGQYCDAGSCTPSSTCSTDAQCADDFWCDYRGTCVPRGDDACRTTADCDGDELCIEGYCRDRDEACVLDRDCAAGYLCVNSECTSPCTSNDACAAGDACIDGYCRPASECTTSAQCSRGESCIDGRCLPDCAESPTACLAGSYCATEDQFCRPDWEPEPFCTEDADCQTGRSCVEGVCRTPCPTMTDAQCRSIDAQLPLCRPENGTYYCFAQREQTPECRVQADCGDGRDCVDGYCRNR